MIESPYFSVDNDVTLYQSLLSNYGLERARKIAEPIFTGNFHSQNWEITKSVKPYEFSYFLSEDGSSLVHDCDLYAGKDILDGITESLRGGLEYQQMVLVKQELLTAEKGASRVWISPKKTSEEIDKDCIYTHTFINIAERVSEKEFKVRQFQTDSLDLSESAFLLSRLSGEKVIRERPSLGELMLTLGGRPVGISDQEVYRLMSEVGGVEMNINDLTEQVARSSREAGRRYLRAIERGVSGEALRQLHVELLRNTIDYKTFKTLFPSGEMNAVTSCGIISSRVNVPNWCEYNVITGELKCKHCKKGLRQSEVNSHRCVC